MKLLVIGIDGGTKDIIEGMPMPFVQSLIKKSRSKRLEEDLISRGWAEALTGEHASDNKGFYLMPCADGSYDFSASYSKSDMVSSSSNKTIWSLLNQKGVSVGIVNVPTTGPADKVKGFIIAGGGGGLKASGDVPDGMVYPHKYKENLEKLKYVFDVRLPGGEKTVTGFLNKIREAEVIQKNAFIELSKIEKPQFGFHCFRITTEVQYLTRYEISECIKNLSEHKARGVDYQPTNKVHAAVIAHYKALDESIKSIFDALRPESFLIIGDHSTALLEHEGNIDVWLNKHGYLRKLPKYDVFLRRAVSYIKRKSGPVMGVKTRPKASLVRKPITKFSRSKTQAFGTFYDTGNFAGIFINDKERFGGPVKSDSEAVALIDKICKEFNSDPDASKFGMTAKPYRREHAGARFQRLMPDIKIYKPDTIYFSSRNWKFLMKNPNLVPLEDSLQGIRYPHTGAKGRDPLFIYSEDLERLIEPDDPCDLRLTYRVVSRFFEQAS